MARLLVQPTLLLLSVALLGFLCTLATAKTFHLQRQSHVYTKTGRSLAENKRDVLAQGHKAAGKVLPMNGGILTTGGFFTQLQVGSGAGTQVFDVIVDTGSSNTAIPSVGCSTCSTNQLYNSTASTSSAKLHCKSDMCQNCKAFAIGNITIPADSQVNCPYGHATCFGDQCGFGFAYGGGGTGTEGTVVTDVACFNGTSICSTIYIDQLLDEFPTGTQSTGIMGLAYSSIACNPTCQPTILDAMAASGTLPNANSDLFGMCLTATQGGKMDLGALVDTRYKAGTMQYTNTVHESFYSIEVKDILVDGVSIGIPRLFYRLHNDMLGAFVDSGTTVVLVAPIAFNAIQSIMLSKKYSHLPHVQSVFGGQGGCGNFTIGGESAIAMYPRIEFTIAGLSGNATDDFKVGIDGTNYLLNSGQGEYCLGIAGVPSVGVILGDVLMQNYYIAFDRSGKKVGFAPLTSC